jgi:hypothetical protein
MYVRIVTAKKLFQVLSSLRTQTTITRIEYVYVFEVERSFYE